MDALMTLLDELSAWSVIKWVILVLVAGFIGQFGKILAQAILKRFRDRGNEKNANGPFPLSQEMPKTSLPADAADDTSSIAPAGKGILDKKAMKTLAKQQKKAIKLTKKS
ncbi:MAG: hypothetical protein CSYNP_03291 [Syntrophus sp. SKADARSKE-3]|nr:hypothetical protein [Syntrophus sp. SKADARSKE-3]